MPSLEYLNTEPAYTNCRGTDDVYVGVVDQKADKKFLVNL